MSDGSSTATAVKPDLAAAAKDLIGLVDSHAEASEAQGALAQEIVDAFHDSGLWAMWVPEVLGGAELEPLPSLEVFEHISYGDASSGWVLMAAALATGCDAAYLGEEAVAELYPGTGRVLVHSGQGTRPGRAVTTDGGYLLSGEWAFASGIKHSEIVHTGSQVQETGEIRLCILPKEQVPLIDNWDVMGLRATGSIDYTIDSAFVAEPYTYNATTDVPLRGGNLYSLGIVNFAMNCHAAWALGVGRRMLDELRKLVVEKAGRPGSMGENAAFLSDYAMTEAKWRGAHAFVHETWADVQETIRRGDPMTVEQNNLTRLALQHATWTVEEVSTFVYTAAATAALRAGTLQRFFRDMHAGTQHFTSGPLARQACGQMLAGLGADKRWMFLGLIDED
jgi:alkylation response protein AidB-like acyl-CoA dehydrogenase